MKDQLFNVYLFNVLGSEIQVYAYCFNQAYELLVKMRKVSPYQMFYLGRFKSGEPYTWDDEPGNLLDAKTILS